MKSFSTSSPSLVYFTSPVEALLQARGPVDDRVLGEQRNVGRYDEAHSIPYDCCSSFVDIGHPGSALYPSAKARTPGTELWRGGGTPATSQFLADLYSGSEGSFPKKMTSVNGTLFFRAEHPTYGQELWAFRPHRN
jgi:ELWxxDGT repeat protein